MKHHSIIARVAAVVGITLGAFAVTALANWTAPHSLPPTCVTNSSSPNYDPGCNQPINVGGDVQTKTGGLGLGNFASQPFPSGTLLDVFGTGVINDLWTSAIHDQNGSTGNAGDCLTSDGSHIVWGSCGSGSGVGSAVTKIIAGQNINISPVTGIGAVTINATAPSPAIDYETCNLSGGYNSGATCTAMCTGAKHVVGGACTSPNAQSITNSYPNGTYTGWTCTTSAAPGGYVNGTGLAICE
ncbi:MAG: hypothetical protein KGI59_03525 [Patescibacteria group bacterium]|nr:hypothetical protein [Patescibacteria group bacterium]MDE2172844.1 hypothetical protein [Patescibacteria group bacterium]